jgi:hypothetical protein
LFLRDWDVNPMPNPPTWRTRVSLLVCNLTLNLSGLGDPASSYATVGIALEIIGARKPHRHKAETLPGGQKSIKTVNNFCFLFKMPYLWTIQYHILYYCLVNILFSFHCNYFIP